MTSVEWLKYSTQILIKSGISTARLDSIILLEDATGKDRSWLLAHPDYTLQELALFNLNSWIKRRASHEPLAYIRGKSMFYGREFLVSNHTLQPRPETETIIEMLKEVVISHQSSANTESINQQKKLSGYRSFTIIDVGTGCGCLAITAQLELPDEIIFGTDISSECIKLAKLNAKNHSVDIKFFKGNLLESLTNSLTNFQESIIMANLPYVPSIHTINKAAMFEPEIAIFGGADGLEYYRQLFYQINLLTNKPRYVISEALPPQHNDLKIITESAGYFLQKTVDFIQLFGRL